MQRMFGKTDPKIINILGLPPPVFCVIPKKLAPRA